MIGRICGDRPHRSIPLDRPGKHGVTSLWQSLAHLAVAGHAVDFAPLWAEFDLGPDPREQPKPKMTVSICGTNYGKRYPPEGGAAALPPPNPVRAQVDKRLNGEVMETKVHKSHGVSESTGGSTTNGAAASMPRPPASQAAAPHENGAASHANGAAKHPTHDGTAEVGGAGLMASREYPPASPPMWGGGQSDASAWLNAYESIQCRTAEAHAVYQQTMAQCHMAFLRTAEQSALALASIAVGAPALPMAPPRAAALPPSQAEGFAMTPMVHAPAVQRRPAPAPAPSMPRPAPRAPSVPAPAPVAEARAVVPTRASVPAPAHAPAPAPAAAPARANGAAPAMPADGDLKSYLFSIVSEKTGYPVDILNLDQQLEADLGIDSIKRVEILSAFEGQIPDIKDVNLEEVTKLATLRDVLGFMDRYADKLGLPKKKE
jgi:acyl carrier protein